MATNMNTQNKINSYHTLFKTLMHPIYTRDVSQFDIWVQIWVEHPNFKF